MKTTYLAPLKISLKNLGSFGKIDAFRIRKLTDLERTIFLGAKNVKLDGDGNMIGCEVMMPRRFLQMIFSELEIMKLRSCEFVIECSDQDYFEKNINKLLLAFRLYKDGNIYAPIIIHTKNPGIHYCHPAFTSEEIKYEIDAKELPKIRSIYHLIQENSDQKLTLAFERFNNALYYKLKKENAFVDFVTILESLFLENGSRELSFRFSLYLTYLLKNHLDIPTDFKQLHEIYDLRSTLVHSGHAKGFSTELYNRTKNYTRAALLGYITNPKFREVKKLLFEDLNII